MKKLATLLTALVVLTPALVMAQETPKPRPLPPEVHAQVKADMRTGASTTKPLPPSSYPKLGPTIKNIASSTRAEFRERVSSTSEMVRARVAAIKEIIEQKREHMKERAENARTKAKERFGENVEKLVGNVSNRLASTSAHLDSIADRIDARIDTLQDEGHDMQSSIALLAEARTSLSVANDKILAVNVALEAAMSTTSPKGQIPQVRTAVKAAEDALRLTKDGLMETLSSVKVEASATTTGSN